MVIPGARSVEQLEANAAAAYLELSTEEAQLIERAARR
jgi:aryl-alcohol dehydrogenase-like predicted oxidoreductase